MVSTAAREFLLNVAKNGSYKPRSENPRREILYEIGKIGSNVNQIAKSLNTAKKNGRFVDVAGLAVELAGIRSALENLK